MDNATETSEILGNMADVVIKDEVEVTQEVASTEPDESPEPAAKPRKRKSSKVEVELTSTNYPRGIRVIDN